MSGEARRFLDALMPVLQRFESGAALRDAAMHADLRRWTILLTAAVFETCTALGWRAAARGHVGDALPIPRAEYLALDVTAFPSGAHRWPFPLAAIELENSRDDDLVAYALWKVLAVRVGVRVVFCYRRTAEAGAEMVRRVQEAVVAPIDARERVTMKGETLLIVGQREEAGAFPHGFFRAWLLDPNTGQFVRC